METKEEVQKMQKRNMKLFPTYKMLSWDYLFFFTIDFLFLTQVKGISAADVVLKSTFYSFFGIILQVVANIIVEFFGRKNSLIIGNILNCVYMVIIMLSRNLGDLIFAEFFSAMAYAIKSITETSILSESIPKSRYKSRIFSHINGAGSSRYYILNAVSKVIAGYLFQINGYIPIAISLVILIISVIMSMFLIEPVQHNKKISSKGLEEFKNIRKGFKYVVNSERLKALIVSYALISALIQVLSSYSTSLLEEIGLTAFIIGLISACINFLCAYASKTVRIFHEKYRNKSISVLSFMLSISVIVSGASALLVPHIAGFMVLVIGGLFIYGYVNGMYYTIRDKYLSNFSNKKIDTKIYAVSQLANNITRVIIGLIASFLLNRTTTAYSMIIMGTIFTIFFILTYKYMKTRVGLRPEQYSDEERKYDEFKLEEKKEEETEKAKINVNENFTK